ncbi:transcriptional regulator, partial [Clostridioides difficile]
IHEHARMVDERYVVTEEERKHILDTSFESMNPLKIKSIFFKRKRKKVVILSKILEQFERGKKYSEKEVNQILESIYDDFATIRRYLIEYGFYE